MIRKAMMAVLAGLVVASLASAQAPARLRWQKGQVLTYHVEQATFSSDQIGEKTTESKTKLLANKRWTVLAVDASGVATLQLSLASLRMEITKPDGQVILFDSADLKKSDPEMVEHVGKHVGQVLAVLRVDGQGKVVEVKESKFGPASRFENELPFVGVLPADGPKTGQTWERAFQLTLEPPLGGGEKHAAVQKYGCKSVAAGMLTVDVTTELKAQPEAVADRVPLVQMQPSGEIVYDLQAGRMKNASLKIDKELKGHQGEGSVYRFRSTYAEQYVSDR
jgi:hypothetical protein